MTQEISPSNDELLAAAYLWGDLDAAEKASFEARLAKEPALRQVLEFQRSVQSALNRERLGREFQLNLETASREIAAGQAASAIRVSLKTLAMAASFALLAGLAGWLWGRTSAVCPPTIPATETAAPSTDEPVAQPGGGQAEDDILVGAGRNSLKTWLPLVRISEVDSLEVSLVKDAVKKAVVKGNEIALHFPANEMPDEKSLWLLEKNVAGERVLYLKMGEKVYRLREGEQALVEETDQEFLK